MDRAILEVSHSSTKKAKLLIGIKAAVLNPSSKEIIPAIEPHSSKRPISVSILAQDSQNSVFRRRAQFFVCIQTQNPITGGFFNRRILLRRKALPWLDKYFGSMRFSDLHGFIGRAGIHDH